MAPVVLQFGPQPVQILDVVERADLATESQARELAAPWIIGERQAVLGRDLAHGLDRLGARNEGSLAAIDVVKFVCLFHGGDHITTWPATQLVKRPLSTDFRGVRSPCRSPSKCIPPQFYIMTVGMKKLPNSNLKKVELLGMAHGTANGRLRKTIMFMLAQRCGMDTCYRCADKIETCEELSIEHKDEWERAADPVLAFFNLENIAFSHLACNIRAAGKPTKRYASSKEQKLAGFRRHYERSADALNARRRAKRRVAQPDQSTRFGNEGPQV